MTQHYRGDRQEIIMQTPSIEHSDIELVCALREAQENEANIRATLTRFQGVTRESLHDSLLELTFDPHTANTALKAGLITGDRKIVKRAASVILHSPYLSDQLKEEAKQHLSGKGAPNIGIIAAGKKKVRGANSRLRNN